MTFSRIGLRFHLIRAVFVLGACSRFRDAPEVERLGFGSKGIAKLAGEPTKVLSGTRMLKDTHDRGSWTYWKREWMIDGVGE
jgi:hypothetical protein